MGSSVACTWESMDSKSALPRRLAPASQNPTQKINHFKSSELHVPTKFLSISKSTLKRANSVASSKATPGCDVPHLTKTPWEVERYKGNSTWRRSGPEVNYPAHVLKKLPKEVYSCIVAQLEQIHLQQDQTCPPCYLRDLHSLSLTSRAWDRAATIEMYRKVHVLGHDGYSQSSKLNIKGPSRLKLLRRTLRERQSLARHVRELHLPDFQTLYQQATIEREEIVNLVASLVMACPSLERLVGFHLPFTKDFDRLSYALATRSKLKERVWLLSEPEDEYRDGEDDNEANGRYLASHDPTERFLDLNSAHPLLTTLVLHRISHETAPTLNFRAIVGTFRQLPMLQHLSISGLPATSFTNLVLNALPSNLRCLRLENLPGVNEKGLQQFVTSHLTTSIEKLTIINLEVSSLATIASILSDHFSSLRHLAIVQYRTPDLGPRMSIPDFFCPTLQFIHFEFRSQSGPAVDPFSLNRRKSLEFPFTNSEPISCLATSLLATNIKDGAFPSLRKVRIPHDPQGVIQALCKPNATLLLPSDTSLFTRSLQKSGPTGYAIMIDSHVSQSQFPNTQKSSFIVPHGPRADSATDSPFFDNSSSSLALTPAKVRFAAQARILAARRTPFITVRVYDPEGEIRIDTAMGGYVGDINSKIIYDLKPDKSRWPGKRDQRGPPQSEWITGIEDLTDERTPPNGRSRERFWGDCRHLIGGRVGCNTVRVGELFLTSD